METIYIPLPKVDDKIMVERDGGPFRAIVTAITRVGDDICVSFVPIDQHAHGLCGSAVIRQPAAETGVKLYKAA